VKSRQRRVAAPVLPWGVSTMSEIKASGSIENPPNRVSPVAASLDERSAMLLDGRIDHIAAERTQPLQSSRIVQPDQTAVANHIQISHGDQLPPSKGRRLAEVAAGHEAADVSDPMTGIDRWHGGSGRHSHGHGGRCADFESDPERCQRSASAALKPLARPTEAMVDAAREAVWFDVFWAINSGPAFKKAVLAMISCGDGALGVTRPAMGDE
jgi:hypothetical protein